MLLPGVALLMWMAASQAPPTATAKQMREYAKLEAQATREKGLHQAEALAQMAQIDFAVAEAGFMAQHAEEGKRELGLASQHADQAVAALQAEAAAGHTNGMSRVEISLQKIAYGLQDLAEQVHFQDRASVEQVGNHFADLRAELLGLMFAPKPKKKLAFFDLSSRQTEDPLTPAEADRVRDTAGALDQRIAVLLKFAEARLTAFQKLRAASPRPPGRDTQLYELLRQYKEILPEAGDSVDDLVGGEGTSATNSGSEIKHYHTAKILDGVIASLSRMNATLHEIQTTSTPADLATYRFMLDDCLDVTSDNLQDAQDDRAHAGAKPSLTR